MPGVEKDISVVNGVDGISLSEGSKIRSSTEVIQGVSTDILVIEYTNRYVAFVTQIEKPGCLIEIVKGTSSSGYDIRFILGKESVEIISVGQDLIRKFKPKKPVLLGLGFSAPPNPALVKDVVSFLSPLF